MSDSLEILELVQRIEYLESELLILRKENKKLREFLLNEQKIKKDKNL